MTPAWLWCPAYPLRDATHRQKAGEAAAALVEGLDLALHASPLLDRFPGPGAWLPAEERRADLHQGLALTGRVRGSWLIAARGGYGCLDLLPTLEAWPDPLPGLLGFSDLTVLLAHWYRRGAPAIHGCMPGVSHGPRCRASTRSLLQGDGARHELAECVSLHPGRAEGRLFAGCLTVLCGLVGTPAMPDLSGAIVALEDLDERPYRIDRMLHQLHAAGCLSGIRGLVFGTFPADLAKDYAGSSAEAICRTWAERLGIPALFGAPIGHLPDPLALPVGAQATLDADGKTLEHGGWKQA